MCHTPLPSLYPLQAKERAEQKKAAKAASSASAAEWFELKKNTSVYVTGLPEDVTLQEMVEVFSKCGIIKEDDQVRCVLFCKWERGRPAGALQTPR